VAGSGGHNDSAVGAATGQIDGDHSFDKSFKGFGYLMVTASAKKLQLDFFEIAAGSKRLFDSVSVSLS
jgi:hypothetical protein